MGPRTGRAAAWTRPPDPRRRRGAPGDHSLPAPAPPGLLVLLLCLLPLLACSEDGTAPAELPEAPSDLEATALDPHRIAVSWSSDGGDLEGFLLQRRVPESTGWTDVVRSGPETRSHVDEGLQAATSFLYRVRAEGPGGASAFTPAVQATTPLPPPPPPPSSLQATAVSPTRIDLAWTPAGADESGFRVERSPDGTTDWKVRATTGPAVRELADDGLEPATPYHYRVVALGTGGPSGPSATVVATTLPPPPPAAPSDLTATASTATRVDLVWSDNSGDESAFRVERARGVNGGWETVALTGPDLPRHTDEGVAPSTDYRYRVRAEGAGGASDFTAPAAVTTPAPSPPAAPSDLTATPVGPTRVELTWSDNSDDETGFLLERTPDAHEAWKEVVRPPEDATSSQDTTARAETGYRYRIRAVGPGGLSDFARSPAVTTPPAPPPEAPSGVDAAAAGPWTVRVTWTPAGTGETSFLVERTPDPGDAWGPAGEVSADSTGFLDEGLEPSTPYRYRVRARSPGGLSTPSAEARAVTEPPPPPAAPTDVTATPLGPTTVAVEWRDVSDDESGFRIELRREGASAWSQGSSVAPDVTADTLTQLDPGTTWRFRVIAFGPGGSSDPSADATATTDTADPPAAPTDLLGTATSPTTVELRWIDASSDETAFVVEGSPDGVGTWSPRGEVGTDVTRWVDAERVPSSSLHYRVRARSPGGVSDPSNEIRVSTPAAVAPRRFRMGWAPTAPTPDFDQVVAVVDSIARVSDIVILQERVPWKDLLSGTSTREELMTWRETVVGHLRGLGMQVIYVADPLNEFDRTQEARELVEAGRSIRETEIRDIHEAWVMDVAERLRPDYLGLAAEINTMADRGDPDVYAEIRDLINELAPRVRQASPGTRVFVSFQVDEANGAFGTPGFDHRTLLDDYDIDVVGLSSYPVFAFGHPSDVPDDWLSRFADATSLPLIVVEAGWSSEDVSGVAGTSAQEQAAFFTRYEELVDDLQADAWVMLTFTDLDVEAYGFEGPRSAAFSTFSRMGILDIELDRKPAYSEWERIFARPFH